MTLPAKDVYRTLIISRLQAQGNDFSRILPHLNRNTLCRISDQEERFKAKYHADERSILAVDGATLLRTSFARIVDYCRQNPENPVEDHPEIFRKFIESLRFRQNSSSFFTPNHHILTLLIHWGLETSEQYRRYGESLIRIAAAAGYPHLKVHFYSSTGEDKMFRLMQKQHISLDTLQAHFRGLWYYEDFFKLGEFLLITGQELIEEQKTLNFSLQQEQLDLLRRLGKTLAPTQKEHALLDKVIDFDTGEVQFSPEMSVPKFRTAFDHIVQQFPQPIY